MKRSSPASSRRRERVGEPEVRVADHPEDVGHAPCDERLGHHVGDRALVRDLGWDADPDAAVLAQLDLELLGSVAELAVARQRAVVVPVPRTAQQPVLDRSLAERPALMRAAIVERAEAARRSASARRCDGRPSPS